MKITDYKFMLLLASANLFLVSCGDSGNSELEKEKLELERQKLELEKSKLKEGNGIDNTSQSTGDLESKENQTPQSNVKSQYRYILGKWTGKLRNKKLTIVIENIDGNTVTGYNIAGSNRRPLKGRIYPDDQDRGGPYLLHVEKLILSEPGDDKFDGVFTLYFEEYEDVDENENVIGKSYIVNGSWEANNGKLSGEVSLTKK